MSSAPAPIANRLWELLADRAALGLDPDSEKELTRLLDQSPGFDEDALDLAAAAVFLAYDDESRHELPVEMQERLSALGTLWVKGDLSVALIEGADEVPVVAGKVGVRGWLGWVAAAAALLFAAVTMWQRPPIAGGPFAGAGLRSQLAALRAKADVVSMPFAPGPDETGRLVTGELVWSDSEQRGYMVFKNLPALDPGKNVYQLWIFDPKRDDRYPVHGGVFAGGAGDSEYIVPIDPHLDVKGPNLFVVTVEPPGGVWVSDRSRIAAVAKSG